MPSPSFGGGPMYDDATARKILKEVLLISEDAQDELTTEELEDADLHFDPDKLDSLYYVDDCDFWGAYVTAMAYFAKKGDAKMCRYLISKGASTTKCSEGSFDDPLYYPMNATSIFASYSMQMVHRATSGGVSKMSGPPFMLLLTTTTMKWFGGLCCKVLFAPMPILKKSTEIAFIRKFSLLVQIDRQYRGHANDLSNGQKMLRKLTPRWLRFLVERCHPLPTRSKPAPFSASASIPASVSILATLLGWTSQRGSIFASCVRWWRCCPHS